MWGRDNYSVQNQKRMSASSERGWNKSRRDMIQGLRRKDGDEWAMMLQKHELESRNKKRVCAEWWQPSHSSTCGGTDWTRRRAFWLPWRPSVSWQMAASERRAPGRPQFPLIGSPRTHSTPHAHMHRLVAYEKGEGNGGHGCFDLRGVRHLHCWCLLQTTLK